ncbi:Alkaline phosphatase [Scedosporium apiospermum]|uniref:alkaline phosphatase n=1 Tax=Pseudallescheria apiosperma TaxID=563466 RepID=A0A084GE03_PSEDA|nr:Alkaline phosphatase [Scedosporium apiospermum]KEZ45565.1 Alkaline phosphatase [Scedosporium apiospermum]
MVSRLSAATALLGAYLSVVSAQTFQRLGACPDLGCVFPPDQADFLPGQFFDLRVEVHAPVNGSEAFNDGVPDKDFSVTVTKKGAASQKVTDFFGVEEPELETWKFSWYEDLFAEDAKQKSLVNVASKIYRRIVLKEPGEYEVTLSYYGNKKTVANWVVRPISHKKKAKNIIFFIGDGMTTNMVTAARLLGHKSINGKYQSLLQLDKFPVLGHQMTHSIDSYITDSANSAASLYSGHKGTVNAMGVYVDSSPDAFDDPKVETITELISRIWGSAWGAVSTAALADATPAALTAHTRQRALYGPIIDQALNGITNYTWTPMNGPDVYFGGGAEQFYPGKGSYQGKDYYQEFANKGYTVSLNKTSLLAADPKEKALGIFCQSHFPVWLDRNVYTENLKAFKNDPLGGDAPALDLPGLKEMTVKAVEILHNRGGDKGFFLMSEAASIDKQMHALDYDRALGDLLELDDTVKATIDKLEELGVLDETLIVVSADHGHGFDVFGSADTKYLASQTEDRKKRRAIGTYANSGLSKYTEETPGISYNTGANFPLNWTPRYAIAAGVAANPDHREDFHLHEEGPRNPAKSIAGEYFVDPKDSPHGFVVNGTLSPVESVGVHSLTDVPVFAMGPCQNLFGGVYNNVDIFYKFAECFGLGLGKGNGTDNCTPKPPKGKGKKTH